MIDIRDYFRLTLVDWSCQHQALLISQIDVSEHIEAISN